MLQIAARKQSTSSPDEDLQYCSRNVAINIKSDSIARQTNIVNFLSYTTMNNIHIIYYNIIFVNIYFGHFISEKRWKVHYFNTSLCWLKHNAQSKEYFRDDKMNHNNVQLGLEANAFGAAEQRLVAEKKGKFLINNVNTRTKYCLALCIPTTRCFEYTRINSHAFKRIRTLNSWFYSEWWEKLIIASIVCIIKNCEAILFRFHMYTVEYFPHFD